MQQAAAILDEEIIADIARERQIHNKTGRAAGAKALLEMLEVASISLAGVAFQALERAAGKFEPARDGKNATVEDVSG